MIKILLLDNYDSFTYNLVQIIRDLGFERTLTIKRNTDIKLEDVASFDKILLSPGPGLPAESGEMMNIIKEYKHTKSILGVCLGHQGIGEVFGARLVNLTEVLHGITSTIIINQPDPIFHQIPERFIACHYHSWVIDPQSVNGDLDVIAIDDKENIMAIRHKHFDIKGVQFHPESILTEHGHTIINNWLKN